MINTINIPRLWYKGHEQPEQNLFLENSYKSLIDYSNNKPLRYYQNLPFLFLIGQAGAGKSTYLKTAYASKPEFLYIDIKLLGANTINNWLNNEKWICFKDGIKDDFDCFTILFDGWDELVEEVMLRRHFVAELGKIPENLRSKLRIRIAARPEIDEKIFLKNLHEECSWLVRDINYEEEYRIVLAELCGDQIREIFQQVDAKEKGFEQFWEWCKNRNIQSLAGHIQTLLFLIKSFTDGTNTWKTLPELWESILYLKVKNVDGRVVDIKRTEQVFTKCNRLNCLGDLAINYLFNQRNPIPHIDNSNDIFELPAFKEGNGVLWPAIKFLLSTPIFTPGGIGNIHFAQSKEAEFLAARRLVKANIGIDNLKGLFIVNGSVPNNLKGLCKWVASYDPQWREELFKYNPNLAIVSLDVLVDSETRSELIRKWWFDEKSFLHDWDTLFLIPDLLKGTDVQWLMIEIENECKNRNYTKLELTFRASELLNFSISPGWF